MIPTGVLLEIGALGLMIVGAVIDLRTRRIPNLITVGGALVGLVANVALHQQAGARSSLSGWALGVALLAVPFILGAMGAGDVKLLALAGAWGGPTFALYTVLYGAVVGGIVALGLLAASGRLGSTFRPLIEPVRDGLAVSVGLYFPRLGKALASGGASGKEGTVAPRRRVTFPYGPALAIGGMVALLVVR